MQRGLWFSIFNFFNFQFLSLLSAPKTLSWVPCECSSGDVCTILAQTCAITLNFQAGMRFFKKITLNFRTGVRLFYKFFWHCTATFEQMGTMAQIRLDEVFRFNSYFGENMRHCTHYEQQSSSANCLTMNISWNLKFPCSGKT